MRKKKKEFFLCFVLQFLDLMNPLAWCFLPDLFVCLGVFIYLFIYLFFWVVKYNPFVSMNFVRCISSYLHFLLNGCDLRKTFLFRFAHRLELKGNKYVLGEFLEFKGKQEDLQALRNIKRSKVSRLIIQKTSMLGFGNL